MTREETLTWLEAFKAEHGYYPNEDPNLLSKGMSAEDAMNEHKRAKTWGEQYQRDFGRPPTEYEYRSEQPRRYSRTGELVSGFGGFTPEKIEALKEQNAGQGSTPDGPRPSSPAKMPKIPMMLVKPPRASKQPSGLSSWSKR